MKQYLLSVHMVEGEPEPPPEEMQQAFKDVDAFNAELQQKGIWVFGGGLEPADVATVVRSSGGEVLTSDGPFAEAKEHLDEALALAGRAAAACKAPVEVRPFQDEPED
jgi:hypothetical protein